MKKMLKASIILSLLFIGFFTASSQVDDFVDCLPCFIKDRIGIKFPDNVYIIIDPGHGAPPAMKGESTGTSSRDYENNPPQSDVQDKPEIAERHVVLEVAQKLREELKSFGFKHIELTRDADISQKNADKAKAIKDYLNKSYTEYYNACKQTPNCCDSFVPIVISLHCNGGPPTASGSETYYQEDMKNYLPGVVLSYLYFFMGNHISIPGPINVLIFRVGIQEEIDDQNYDFEVQHTLCELGYLRNKTDYYKLVNNKNQIARFMSFAIYIDALYNTKKPKYKMKLCKPPDKPDDNYSNASGTLVQSDYSVDLDSSIFLPFEFSNDDTLAMINKVYGPPAFYGKETTPALLEKYPLMVIPSGALMGQENDSTLKTILEQYVRSGHTIVVFSQQYGDDVDKLVPVPEGESLDSYGFREDQSCQWGSLFTDVTHPVLSSLTAEQVSAAVDGYFSAYPDNSRVLLSRIKNREAALIVYPYGAGNVILTSLYTDFAYANSQAPSEELKIARDLLTFATDPHSAIPMFNVSLNPHPTVSLNIAVVNKTGTPASRVKMKFYTPDRKQLLHQADIAIGINPGQSQDVPVSFVLPDVTRSQYGIGVTRYELYASEDEEEIMIQWPSEVPSGRFAIYGNRASYTPASKVDMWLTVGDEAVWWDEPVDFTLHIKNYKESAQTFSFDYEWNHWGKQPLFEVLVPAGGKVEKQFQMAHGGGVRLWLYTQDLPKISKGIEVKWPVTESQIEIIGPDSIKIGSPIGFAIESLNTTGRSIDGLIRVSLEQRNSITSHYEKIAGIYQTRYCYGINESFQYSGTYTLAYILPPGPYRLKGIFLLKNPGNDTIIWSCAILKHDG